VWGRYLVVDEHNIPWKVDWKSRADCMDSSVAVSNFDGSIPMGDLKEDVSAVPTRTIEDLAKFQAAVTTAVTNLLSRICHNIKARSRERCARHFPLS
jgi:hypothetical protein